MFRSDVLSPSGGCGHEAAAGVRVAAGWAHRGHHRLGRSAGDARVAVRDVSECEVGPWRMSWGRGSVACNSPAHAAQYLDISVTARRSLVARGELISVKLGGFTRYARVDLDALIERLRRGA